MVVMHKYYLTQPLLLFFLIFMSMSFSCYSQSYSHVYPTDQSLQSTSQQNKEMSQDQQSKQNQKENRQNQATGKEELAQTNRSIPDNKKNQSIRRGNWDYKSNWRYNRDSYFKGKTQAQAYRENHPTGSGGVGFDADDNYRKNQNNSSSKEIAENRLNRNSSQNSSYNRHYNENSNQTNGNQENQKDKAKKSDISYESNINESSSLESRNSAHRFKSYDVQ